MLIVINMLFIDVFKAAWCLAEFWIHLWNMPVLFILFKISSLQRYGLKTFTGDLNAYQGLEKLVYCWIILRDSASVFIIFKNAWDLVWTSFKFQCKGTKRQKRFVLYQSKHNFHYYLTKNRDAIVTLGPTVSYVGSAWTVRKQRFLKV